MPLIIGFPGGLRDYNDPNITYNDNMVHYNFLIGGSILGLESDIQFILKGLPHLTSQIDLDYDLRYSFARRLTSQIDIDSIIEYNFRRPASRKLKIYSGRHRSQAGNAKALYGV